MTVFLKLRITVRRICEVPRMKFTSVLGILHTTKYTKVLLILKSLLKKNLTLPKAMSKESQRNV